VETLNGEKRTQQIKSFRFIFSITCSIFIKSFILYFSSLKSFKLLIFAIKFKLQISAASLSFVPSTINTAFYGNMLYLCSISVICLILFFGEPYNPLKKCLIDFEFTTFSNSYSGVPLEINILYFLKFCEINSITPSINCASRILLNT